MWYELPGKDTDVVLSSKGLGSGEPKRQLLSEGIGNVSAGYHFKM